MLKEHASDNHWVQALGIVQPNVPLEDSVVQSMKIFSGSYNCALKSLQALTNTPCKISGEGILLPHWEAAVRPTSGDCVDLAMDLLNLWMSSGVKAGLGEAGVGIYYCEGTEPRFFNTERDNHAFIGLAPGDSSDIKVVVDPALQVICEFSNSGYSIRSKGKNPQIKRSPEREIRFTDLPTDNWVVADFLTADAAVLGLTNGREVAISLGFARRKNLLCPFLVIARDKGRGVIYHNIETGQLVHLLSELGEISDPANTELSELSAALRGFRFVSIQ